MTETTKATHTPGPWQVYRGPMSMDGGLNPFFKGIVALLKHSGDGDEIAVILDRDEPAYDYEANARLIAAAPDLLAALEVVSYVLKDLAGNHTLVVGSSVWGLINDAVTKARGS